MVNKVSNTYYYNGNVYERRTHNEAKAAVVLAMLTTGLLYKALPSFSNPFLKQMNKEHANNGLYKDAFVKAVNDSGLKEKGLKILHLDFSASDAILPRESIKNFDVKQGVNAFFSPKTKEIVLNLNKATITGFHELGHAMNNLSGKFGKILQKMRGPGYWIAGLMGTVALFTRPKPKNAPRDGMDWVQDNCALIATAGMLPTVAEEALASYKGVQAAKKAGLAENLVKNLKKFYGKALLSYVGYAAITGLSIFAMSKIMEIFTRPKKLD